MADYTKWSPSHSGRSDAPVIWLAIHTAEDATTAESLMNYLGNPNNEVSYHAVCDDSTTSQCIDYTKEPGRCSAATPFGSDLLHRFLQPGPATHGCRGL